MPRRRRSTPPNPKRRRKTPAPTPAEKPITPMGGFLQNPPDDCEYGQYIRRHDDGGVWVDRVFCGHYCQRAKNCTRYLEDKKTSA
jgi:hypothetical protein